MNLDYMIHDLNPTARCEAYYPLFPSDYVDFVVIALLLVSSFIFSLITSNRKTDFRPFKKYLFIYVINKNIMNAIIKKLNIQCVADKFTDPVTITAYTLIAEGFNFYFGLSAERGIEFYNNHIIRQNLKTNLWDWGVLFLICLFTYFIIPALVPAPGSFIILVPLGFTGIIYIRLLFSMLKTSAVSKKKKQFLRMIIFLVMLGILLILTLAITPKFWINKSSLHIIKLLYLINDLTIILYFLTAIYILAIKQEY